MGEQRRLRKDRAQWKRDFVGSIKEQGKIAGQRDLYLAAGKKAAKERDFLHREGRRVESERDQARAIAMQMQQQRDFAAKGRTRSDRQLARTIGARDRIRREAQNTIAMMQSQNRDLMTAVGRKTAEAMQMHEVHKQDTGALRQQVGEMGQVLTTAEQKAADEAKRALQLQSEMRARHAGQLHEERTKTGSALDQMLNLRKNARAQIKAAADRIAALGNQIQQGNATLYSTRQALDRTDDELAKARKALADARRPRQLTASSKSSAQQQKVQTPAPVKEDGAVKKLEARVAEIKRLLERQPRGASGSTPIVVQGGAGGGGASAAGGAAGGSSASGAGPARQGADLGKIVEAVKAAASAGKKAPAKGGTTSKGITRARRTYTDKRKTKLAELRSLKSKRIREFNAKTKKMNKADRNKARREFKKKVESQFKEMQSRFPTARGLKSVGVIRELIRKIDAIKTAR